MGGVAISGRIYPRGGGSMNRDRARQLRKDMTDAERFAWQRILYRQIGGHKFRRQAPIGPFIADFICHECRLIVELDGGQHAEQREKDDSRTRWFENQGYRVLRFWNHEILQEWDAVAEVIWRHVQSSPQPSPTRGEGAMHPPPQPSPTRGEGARGEATMNSILKQILFILVLAGLLGAAFAFDRAGPPPPTFGREQAMRNYGFYLEEVAKQSGVDFTHHGPTKLDAKLQHILPVVAAMGASVSVVDFDRDGWPDLFVVTGAEGGKCALYRNQHDGTFKDVAEEVGLADLNREGTGVCMGAVWGDYDNDGYDDVLVYKWGRPVLYHNDKGKHFTPVPQEKSGLPDWMNANSACWLDYDRDGKLDLFIAGYWRDDLDLWHLARLQGHARQLRVRHQRRGQTSPAQQR